MSDGAKRARTLAVVIGAAVVGLAIGVGAVYGIGGFQRNASAEPDCSGAMKLAARIEPLVKGEVAALVPAQSPLSVADLRFNKPDGTAARLADWKGRTVLVNLWATWCVPCRLEMPALDRLQAALGSDRFEVVAVNIDTKDPDKPKQFLQDIKVEKLAYYADPSLGVFKTLQQRGRSRGMPTTMLVDPKGCEIATINGPAEWDHADAKAVIEAALKPES